ncbi:YgaP family membrane protein [Zhongshania sp. BJYM1]|uniref:YgaP family membrane protein n=1 Tax=Zhongshania aquatica TaxID=2965069 RepID=UPI0022B3E056|nr:DUF2892 domain-containing protein [Marortus sp. BJYM1]
MKCNVGKTDRNIRIIVGLFVIAVGVFFKSWLGLIGAIPLVTAALGWCPIYVPFGLTTYKDKTL